MQLRAGVAGDASSIRALLEVNSLPTSDLARSSPQFIVACDEADRIVAAGALQPFGESALLRSVVVMPELRGTVKKLGLLTLSAQRFFERQGYEVIARQAMPRALQDSDEFRSLCPESAVCMVKSLVDV